MASNKKLSIVIAAYNVEKYISECIESCLHQDFDNYEIVCVDDGSKDTTPILIDGYANDYPDKVKVVHKQNGGVSSARNIGLSVATGEWVWFVDGDDFISENCLYSLTSVLKENDEMLFFDSDRPTNYKRITFDKNIKIAELNDGNFFDLRPSNASGGGAWSYWLKRDVINKNSLVFDKTMKYCEDVKFVFQYRLYCNKRGVMIDDIVYHYRRNEFSTMHHVDIENYLYSMEKMFETYYECYKKAENRYIKTISLNRIADAVQAIQSVLLFDIRDYKLAKEKIDLFRSLGVYPVKRHFTELQKKERKPKSFKKKLWDNFIRKLFNIRWIYLFMCKLCSKKGKNK